MAPPFDPAKKLAESLDSPAEISVGDLFQKFLLHWKLFLACAIVAPLVAVGLAALVPATYKATAQVLVQHQGGAFTLSGEAAPLLSSLSGATTAEIMRSGPVVSAMIKKVGVVDADIPRPAYKVLFGRVAKIVLPLFGGEAEDTRFSADPDAKFRALAGDLKPDIEASTLLVERTAGTLHDELVEVTLKANSREKVADMVNSLCDSLVDETNKRAKADMLAAYKTLGEQAALVESDLERRKAGPSGSDKPFKFERAANADNEPLAAGLARSISELELEISTLLQTYADNAPEVIRVRNELERAEARLADQEATDAATDQLSAIRKTQRELLLAARMSDTGQGGLSVVERAIQPKRSKLVQVMRFGIPAAAGLAGGVMVGALAIVMLNLLDPRLYIASDVASVSGLRLLGTIPAGTLGVPETKRWIDLPPAESRPALLQVLARMDALDGEHPRVIAVTSPENESPTASVALNLAALMARARNGAVLLVDANFDGGALTRVASRPDAPGVIDVSGGAELDAAIQPVSVPRMGFVGTGPVDRRDATGHGVESWRRAFASVKGSYPTIIVHLPGLLNSREAAALAKSADQVLLVTARRGSNRHSVKAAAGLLAELGTPVLGVVHCEGAS
jgi:Mrp family chromosome partitioning ATPase